MNRRHFLQTSVAGLASLAGNPFAAFTEDKPKRVGLIGCGWYGKIDLIRLIQIAPVEVVSLCDVKPVADIEERYISTACCVLANLSTQLGRSLRWDPAAQRIAGDEEVNRLLRRPYRKPWEHPEPERV